MDNKIEAVDRRKSPPMDVVPRPTSGFLTQIFHDFQQFMFTNNVIIVATGWGIGTATRDMIERLVQDMFIPILRFLGKFSMIKFGYTKLMETVASTKMEGFFLAIGNITWDFMIWIIVIVMTFVLLEYILNRSIIGLRTTVPDQSKFDFAKSKAAAKEKIIPNERDREILQKQILLEEKTGERLIQRDVHALRNNQQPTNVPSRF